MGSRGLSFRREQGRSQPVVFSLGDAKSLLNRQSRQALPHQCGERDPADFEVFGLVRRHISPYTESRIRTLPEFHRFDIQA